MAEEKVIIRYKADVDEFIKQMNVVIEQQEAIAKEADTSAKSFQKSVNSETLAAKKRAELIAQEKKNIEELRGLRAKAFDPAVISKFNQQINESAPRIRVLQDAAKKTGDGIVGAFGKAGQQIKNIGLGIAAGFGVAFSVDAILNFGKASVDAFLEAENNANRLKFAITQVNNESKETFERLIKQSERLQAVSIFSDDDIQKAQTALATFGLTATQIEQLIPRILDLASANKIDLAQATDTVLRGIEGQQKGLKLLGVQLTSVGTETENYNQIIEQTAKFTGAAAEATQTLSGELEQAKNRYDDLQEFVGAGLASVFQSAKMAIYEAIGALFQFDKSIDQVTKRSNANAISGVEALVAQFKAQGKSIEQIKAGLKAGADEAQKSIDQYTTDLQRAEFKLALINAGRLDVTAKEFETINKTIIANKELLVNATAIKEAYAGQLASLDEIENTNKRIITAESLRGKTIEELIKLKDDELKINDSIARSNAEIIQKQIDALQKLAEAQKKASEKRAADAKAAAEKEAAAMEKMYQDAQRVQDDYIKSLEQKRKEIDDLLEFQIKITLNNEGADAALNKLRDELRLRYEEEAAFIEKNAQIDGESAEVTNAKKLKAYEQFAAEFKKIAEALGLFVEQQNENDVKSFLDRNAEIINSVQFLLGQISDIVNRNAESQISAIEKTGEAFNEQLNQEEQALQESKDKRLISDAEYQKKNEEIQRRRVDNEKKIQAQINKERKKQATISKIATIFEIQLKTAQAIVEALAAPFPLNTILPAIIGALAAAQLAAVASQPVPAFAKGTKGKKGSGMALVGEQGPEITFLPDGAKVLPAKQTKTYGEVFDAMYDNKFDKYIMQKYVAPALAEQKRKFEERKENSFASNITNSLQYNGINVGDLIYANKRGTNIKNTDELAYAIAKALKTDGPSQWRM
jgi:hypothetical protein